MNDKERQVKLYELEAISTKLANIEGLIKSQKDEYVDKSDWIRIEGRVESLEKFKGTMAKISWTIGSTIIVAAVTGIITLLRGV